MRAITILGAILGFAMLIILAMTAYVVDEGNVAVITKWSKATHQEGPDGLKLRNPITTGVKEFDVRERVLTGELNAATSNQLVITMAYSVNWQPDPAQIMTIYQKYGTPEEFAANTIRPRLNQSLKATIGKFTGEDLIRKREEVAAAMLERAKLVLGAYPAFINSAQVENFTLPNRYMEAVLQKEEQRQLTEREQLILEQQDISAKQAVQSANAQRDATKAKADGDAYATRSAAEAQADAIRVKGDADAAALLAKFKARSEGQTAIAKALGSGQLAVEYARNIEWDGALPVTVLGNQPDLLMQMQQ